MSRLFASHRSLQRCQTGKKPFKLFFFRKKKAAPENQQQEQHQWAEKASIDSNIVRNLEYELDTLFNSYFSGSKGALHGEDESIDTMDMCSLSSETISECGSYDESLYGGEGNQCSMCTNFRHLLFFGGE
jgi:hypothetical protein